MRAQGFLTASLVWAACAFTDPHAPPPQDPCIKGAPESPGKYWAWIDGPAPCADLGAPDTLTHFSGSGWNAPSALCRAKDVYLNETTKPNNAANIELTDALRIPANTFGYCIVNAGTPSEVISYSVCGTGAAAAPICNTTLPMLATSEITAQWFDCPGGAACPEITNAGDACSKLGAAMGTFSFSTYVDYPFYACKEGLSTEEGGIGAPVLEDLRDTQFLSLGALFGWQSASCMASAALDLGGKMHVGISAAWRDEPPPRAASGGRSGRPQLDRVIPEGASGYCLYGEDDDPYQYAMYSLCDLLHSDDARIADNIVDLGSERFSRARICEEGYPGVESPRIGLWYPCPGSELCY